MERTELAWAAGFWDGEGSAYLTGADARTTKYPQARINQSSPAGVPEVLVRFQRVLGFGRIQGPDLAEGREPLYRWVVSSRADVNATFDVLRAWLGDVKRAQFRDVLGVGARVSDGRSFTSRDEWVAWCAGLFDGEGSVCLLRHGSHVGYFVLEANITQSSWTGAPEVLERFRMTFNVGAIYGPYPGSEGHAPVYKWRAYRQGQIQALIAAMGPHLGGVKREQATAAIAVVASQPQLPRGNPAWGNRKRYCVNGHEYATARVRPYRQRREGGIQRRDSKQCLACSREQARERRRRTEVKDRRPRRRSL
jgi:hypothetical protein